MDRAPNSTNRAARHAGERPGPDSEPAVRPWAGSSEGGLGEAEREILRADFEAFAGELSAAWRADPGLYATATLASLEELRGAELADRTSNTSLSAGWEVSGGGQVFISFDADLALALVDSLLGGTGGAPGEARALTEIERGVIESVVESARRALAERWGGRHERTEDRPPGVAPVKKSFETFPAGESLVVANFELGFPCDGRLHIALPSRFASRLLRGGAAGETDGPAARLRRRLRECRFSVELKLPASPVSGEELMKLEKGQVLVLLHGVDEPALLSAGGKEMFTAFPVQSNGRRAAQIQQKISGVRSR